MDRALSRIAVPLACVGLAACVGTSSTEAPDDGRYFRPASEVGRPYDPPPAPEASAVDRRWFSRDGERLAPYPPSDMPPAAAPSAAPVRSPESAPPPAAAPLPPVAADGPPEDPRARVSCRVDGAVSVVSAGYCYQMKGTVLGPGSRGEQG